jgi:VWFA-related protein
MRTSIGLLFLGALGFFVCSFQDPRIRVEVEAVNVFVTVTDEKGRFVTGLPKENFIVYEDGVVQNITNFSQETNLPLSIGLLMDTSASVRLQLDFEKEAATNFIYSVMRSQDQALLVERSGGPENPGSFV